MTPEQLREKHRLFQAAMTAGDYEVAEGLAVELEPYMQVSEDDHEPRPTPVWETDR